MARLTLRRASVLPFGIYALGCLAAFLLINVSETWLPLLFVSGIFATFIAWKMTRWSDTWSRYFSMGAVLLLACMLGRVLYALDFIMAGPRFDEWPFFVHQPRIAVLKGELMSVLGTLITVFAWRTFGGARFSPATIVQHTDETRLLIPLIYVCSLVGMFIYARVPWASATLGQLLSTLYGLGLVASFLVPYMRLTGSLNRLLATMALGAPFVVAASGTGMKEDIILSLLPTAVMAWQHFRHPALRIGLVTAGLVAIALITSYVNMYRTEAWTTGGASQEQVMEQFVQGMGTSGAKSSTSGGFAAFVERANQSYAHGWAVSIADEDKHYPRLVFAPLSYVFVPRVLWPGKPVIRQGWEYSGLVFGSNYISWSQSSTAAGFYPSLYLGQGWIAVFLGAFLTGLLLVFTTRMAMWIGGDVTAGLFVLASAPSMLRLGENWAASAVPGLIISLLYICLIVAGGRRFGRLLSMRRHLRVRTGHNE